MWIRTTKSRGKIYYQLMDGQGINRKVIAHLGSAGKVFEIFQFWDKNKDLISDLSKMKSQFSPDLLSVWNKYLKGTESGSDKKD